MKYSVYLKKQKTKRKPVIVKFNFGYKKVDPLKGTTKYQPLLLDSGVKLEESEWDSNTRMPVRPAERFKVEELIKTVVNIYDLLKKQGVQITPELLKDELSKYNSSQSETSSTEISITDYIEQKIENSFDLNTRTRHHYGVIKRRIQSFEELKRIKLTTANLNRQLYLEFQGYCKTQLGKHNSVWSNMKIFKAVINRIRRDYPELSVFNPMEELSKGDKVQYQSQRKVFLDFDQIKLIMDYEPKTESQKNVKLILLTLLFTGCRYSDVFKIKPEQSYDDKGVAFHYCQFISQKSDSEIVLPLLKPLMDAIEDNEGNTAYKISVAKFNDYARTLCGKAGLNHEVKLAFTNSFGKKEFETKPFYDFISSHIGRRSFISNLISAIPITVLAKITGHSFNDREVIFQYDKKTPLQNAVIFVKELRRVCEDRPEDFPIQLV